MKIIALQNLGDGLLSGWLETEIHYCSFIANEKQVEYKNEKHILKTKYKSYEHFVGVMSKFDPYTFFLKNPIVISELTPENVNYAYKQIFDT